MFGEHVGTYTEGLQKKKADNSLENKERDSLKLHVQFFSLIFK